MNIHIFFVSAATTDTTTTLCRRASDDERTALVGQGKPERRKEGEMGERGRGKEREPFNLVAFSVISFICFSFQVL
jgi:hypothetical protein